MLQKNLVCTWGDFASFGALPSQRKCRMVFDNIAQFHAHIRDAHRWHCVACSQINGGAMFPRCELCGNSISEDAEDGDQALKHAVAEVQTKMATFFAAEKSAIEHAGDKYVMKERFIKLSMEKMERVKLKREALKKKNSEVAEEEKSATSSKSRGTIFADDGASGAASTSANSKKKKKKRKCSTHLMRRLQVNPRSSHLNN